MISDLERFLGKIRVDNKGCWIWEAALYRSGYGAFSVKGKSIQAHRWSWSWFNDAAVPDGLWVLHRCDKRQCVNPRHLYVGDRYQNAKDVRERSNHNKGENNHSAKLTADKVRLIRMVYPYITMRELGKMFGVHEATIADVIKQRTWKEVGYAPNDT